MTTTVSPPRFRTVTGAGTIVALVLVLAFGNSAYRDWAEKHTSTNDAGGLFLRRLGWPAWSFDSNESLRSLLATDLKALLLVVLTALFLSLLSVTAGFGVRGVTGAILGGWGAYIFAAAVAGLIAAFVNVNATLVGALNAAGDGALYGLFVGWIVGLTTLVFRA
ncbi:MAG TPA: hypothetical protein VGJ53_14300 [Micromonosporaceae bacterium]